MSAGYCPTPARCAHFPRSRTARSSAVRIWSHVAVIRWPSTMPAPRSTVPCGRTRSPAIECPAAAPRPRRSGRNTRGRRRAGRALAPSALCLAGDELADAGGADPLAVLDEHLPAHDRHRGHAAEAVALPDAVVAVRVQVVQGDRLLGPWIDENDVGVAAGRDDPLAGVEAEEPRRIGAGDCDQCRDADLPGRHPFGEERHEPRLHAIVATGDVIHHRPRELGGERDGVVVGGDGVPAAAGGDRLPQGLPVLLALQGWVVVIREPARTGVRLAGEDEVVVEDLAVDRLAVAMGGSDRVYRLAGGDVDDVERAAAAPREQQHAADRRLLGEIRSRQMNVGPLPPALPVEPADVEIDDAVVLAVNLSDSPAAGQLLHPPPDPSVVGEDGPGGGRPGERGEHLEGHHPLGDGVLELLDYLEGEWPGEK